MWLRRALFVVSGVILAGLIVTGVGLAGLTAAMADTHRNTTQPGPWPAPPALPSGRTVVAVVVGSTGTVVTDALAPYEVFASSPAFAVYTVSAERAPASLTGGLPLLPDYTFADAPAPDVVVVPAVAEPTGSREAPMRDWIAAQHRRGARILGVCSGSWVLAEAGVLEHRRATSFWARLDGLAEEYPAVSWVAGERYVQDGQVTTTAGVTSGVVGALRLVSDIAGPAEAERIGAQISYPQWTLSGPTEIALRQLALEDLPYALNALFPWGRPTVGIGLTEGVGEIDVAAAFELYAGTSSAARAIPLATSTLVRTRHGATLVAEPDGAVDRFVVPGVTSVPGPLRDWASSRGLRAELPHAGRAPGEFSFDPILRDLASHADRATARTTAKYTEYPAGDVGPGPAWPWRPTLLALGTLALAAAAGILVPRWVVRLAKARDRGGAE